jgi:hypothetical protein
MPALFYPRLCFSRVGGEGVILTFYEKKSQRVWRRRGGKKKRSLIKKKKKKKKKQAHHTHGGPLSGQHLGADSARNAVDAEALDALAGVRALNARLRHEGRVRQAHIEAMGRNRVRHRLFFF